MGSPCRGWGWGWSWGLGCPFPATRPPLPGSSLKKTTKVLPPLSRVVGSGREKDPSLGPPGRGWGLIFPPPRHTAAYPHFRGLGSALPWRRTRRFSPLKVVVMMLLPLPQTLARRGGGNCCRRGWW